MSGITGWIHWRKDLTGYPMILENMTETLIPRGPDASGTWISRHCALGHRRLGIMDPENGVQPMVRKIGDRIYTLVYNGELYNARELRSQLEENGHVFQTTCDTEVLLLAYVEWGRSCVEMLDGIFAFALWDDDRQNLFLARDRLGVKPLFYALHNELFIFGSEPKAILAHPDFPVEITSEGLAEVFALGPARTPGHGVYRYMAEVKPGHCMTYDQTGLSIRAYWKLISQPHEDNEDTTAEKVRELLGNAVRKQLNTDVKLGTLLSGGLDSSAVAAFAVEHFKAKNDEILHTFSVDYVDNDKHFKANTFQPNSDGPWIKRMSEFLGTEHTYIQFDTPELVDGLRKGVYARDLPGMADIDISLYLFCQAIKPHTTVVISGEAADEIFGGYPWFYNEEALSADTFPWSLSLPLRNDLLARDFIEWIRPTQYVAKRYEEALAEVPKLSGETAKQSRMREMSYLNITRFGSTLLDRKDRMCAANGIEARVPFCDHQLVEYVWNIPWEMKTAGGREKGILRKALKGLLPDDVVDRKKSPYPKTHNPNYLSVVRHQVLELLNDGSSPLLPLINRDKILALASSEATEFHFPWFGQLMSGPQLFAYLIQVDTWLREYKVSIK